MFKIIGVVFSALLLVQCSKSSSDPNGATCTPVGQLSANGIAFTPLFSDSNGVARLVKTLTTESPVFSNAYAPQTVGFVYTPTCSQYSNVPLPLSYWTSIDYFGDYAWQIYYSDATQGQIPVLGQGAGSGNTAEILNVKNQYNAQSYEVIPSYSALDPSGSLAAGGVNLQYERINTGNGTDIYDAACYQIALALAKVNQVATLVDLQSYIGAQNAVFSVNHFNGADGNDSNCGSAGGNRGLTNAANGIFYYGGSAPNGQNNGPVTYAAGMPLGLAIAEPLGAYSYRMLTQKWTSLDPFWTLGCQACEQSYRSCTLGLTECEANRTSCLVADQSCTYASYVSLPDNLPAHNSAYFPGVVTWADYKPITGENVWGLMMGPMVAANILAEKLTTSDTRYQVAKGLFSALQNMQSKCTGAIYYAVQGSLGNTGSLSVNPFQISTENNASTLGALLAFRKALSNMVPADPENLIPAINGLIWGQGGSATSPVSPSILSYFKNYSWDKANGYFKQGVTESYDASGHCTVQYSAGANAIDVNTWGIAALGPELLDTWFGAGTAYQDWIQIKKWGGYYDPATQQLMGVGYSDQDNNGPNKKGGIMSAEWSFGAINFVRALISYYGDKYPDLLTDEQAMVQGVLSLHSDYYATAEAFQVVNNDLTTGRPANYAQYVPTTSASSEGGWFIYASKRYFIPFGWFSNPLPSLTSTSWGVMTQYGFNPFNPDGNYSTWWSENPSPNAPGRSGQCN
ncbi:MAG: hypothetical protein I8H75_01490 [Myxococcaceae bacterium]|nr:hypothetical protein [Myxococcaceae bacterium]MBH2006012.1 hypothetical protein [Myxococcaceae bacterium]